MSFLVEDGTGTTGANSYLAVDDFKAYHNERGNDITGLSTGTIQKLLIKATDYVERRWGQSFQGSRAYDDQPLTFPRADLLDDLGNEITGIPLGLGYAVAEYALIANTQDLFLTPTTDETGLSVRRTRTKVGPIEEEVQYGATYVTTLKAFPQADTLLTPYLLASGETMRA